jgi:multicomponent Na+:H+ antiporter subunit G
MHASTKAGTVGSGLVLIGAALAFGEVGAWLRAVAILAFLLATTPVAASALGRAAYVGGTPLWKGTVADQLAGVLPRGAFDLAEAERRRRALQPEAEEAAGGTTGGGSRDGAAR